MRNDGVITVMSHHFLMVATSYVRYIYIHIVLKFQLRLFALRGLWTLSAHRVDQCAPRVNKSRLLWEFAYFL